MLSKVKETINKYKMLSAEATVITAVSGGADSITMLHCLIQLGFAPIVAHIEHGIRGHASLKDMEFVQEYCIKQNLPCKISRVDVPSIAAKKHISLEQAAREARYEFLRVCAQEFRCPIAVAHNGDDQAETVLLHLLRGSGLGGLCAMSPVSNDIIRPLLFVSRKEIEQYCLENRLTYVTDLTNADVAYTRNKIRHQLLPLLKEQFNVNINATLCRTANILQGDLDLIEEYISTLAKSLISFEENAICLNTQNFCLLQLGTRRRLVRRAVALVNGYEDIEQKHIDAVLKLLEGQSGRSLNICNGILCTLSYNKLIFYNEVPLEKIYTYEFELNTPFNFESVYAIGELTNVMGPREANCEYLDYDNLPNQLTLRTKLKGDYIYPIGMYGKCKLKEYLINKKIPAARRNKLVMLAKHSEIYAIIDVTISRKAIVANTSKNILKLTLEVLKDNE